MQIIIKTVRLVKTTIIIRIWGNKATFRRIKLHNKKEKLNFGHEEDQQKDVKHKFEQKVLG
jgi:hypothetical protein